MAIKQISILGFRGFSTQQTVEFAVPNGLPGSGLTYLLGQNNSGKSTIAESLRILGAGNVTISEGKRNKSAGERLEIELEYDTGEKLTAKTIHRGGAPVEQGGQAGHPAVSEVLVLPSRRSFSPYFGLGDWQRTDLASNLKGLSATRTDGGAYHYRLNTIFKDDVKKQQFDALLGELAGRNIDWTIDQTDSGQHYLKVQMGNSTHSSDGTGDGLNGIFVLAAALFDSVAGGLICIDEPELSLHPAAQRRLRENLTRMSADRQIVIATHSPLLVDWTAISRGAGVARCVRDDDGIRIHNLPDFSKGFIGSFLSDRNNPHVFGLDASEIFFLDDGILLVEGQEDVLLLPEVLRQLDIGWRPKFFGWGTGGASKMTFVAEILNGLGFLKVGGILDGGKVADQQLLQNRFPHYRFFVLPAADIRAKEMRPAKAAVEGVLDRNLVIQSEYADTTACILRDLKMFL